MGIGEDNWFRVCMVSLLVVLFIELQDTRLWKVGSKLGFI